MRHDVYKALYLRTRHMVRAQEAEATLDVIITTYFTAGRAEISSCRGGRCLHWAQREGIFGVPRIQGLGDQVWEHRGPQAGLRFIEEYIPGPLAGDMTTPGSCHGTDEDHGPWDLSRGKWELTHKGLWVLESVFPQKKNLH